MVFVVILREGKVWMGCELELGVGSGVGLMGLKNFFLVGWLIG